MINFDYFEKELNNVSIELDDYAFDRFDVFAQRLVRWNEHINLTAITDPDEIVLKHFVDCLYINKFIDILKQAKVIDVGTGAGFPGMPMLIADSSLDMTFLDSVGKKLAFLREVLKYNGIYGELLHGRAEDIGRDKNYREKYDIATARAVAPLNKLCEYCLPFVKVGGIFVSLKGANAREEITQAKKANSTLGGKLVNCFEYELSSGDKRSIIVIKKISQTPTRYPRKPKKIDTKPL